METGFNTDVEYQKKIFHVQTEESGPQNPVIITHLFYKGAILSSRRTEYGTLLNPGSEIEKLRELMKKQHEEMIASLLNGQCNHLLGEGHSGREKGLDDYIDDYIRNKK